MSEERSLKKKGIIGGDLAPMPLPEQVVGFYDVNALDAAFLVNEFDIAEEIESLISLSRSPNEQTRLQALKHLRNVTKDIMAANGLTAKATMEQVQDANGNTTTKKTVESKSLVKRLGETDGSNRTDIGDERYSHIPAAGDSPGEGAAESPDEDVEP